MDCSDNVTDVGPNSSEGHELELDSGFHEYLTLTDITDEFEAQVPVSVQNHGVVSVMSPTFFVVTSEGNDLSRDNWRDAFNAVYNNMETAIQFTVTQRWKTMDKTRWYACLDPERHNWERVQLMTFDFDELSARVLYCDTLEIRDVPVHNLRELVPPFVNYPQLAFYASLVDIRPMDGESEWTQDACEYFREFVRGKTFTTIVVGQIGFLLADGESFPLPHFGVCMIEESPNKAKCTLQAQLIKNGFAEADGVFSNFPGMLDVEGQEIMSTCWDAGASESLKKETSTSSGGLKLNEQKEMAANIEKLIKSIQCLKLKEKHGNGNVNVDEQEPQKVYLGFGQIKTLACALENLLNRSSQKFSLPRKFQECLGIVRIAHVISPSWMYLQFTSRLSSLQRMEQALGHLVESMPHISLSERRAGIGVACLFHRNSEDEPIWARAVVKACLTSVRLLKVLMVDYGQDITVSYTNARYLPLPFVIIPSYAHRVFMDFTHLAPKHGPSWNVDSRNTFRKHINTSAYYLKVHKESIFSLASFSQEMIFTDGKWVPDEVPRKISYAAKMIKVLDSQRITPMLANYFLTFGVELLNLNSRDTLSFNFDVLEGSIKSTGCVVDNRDN